MPFKWRLFQLTCTLQFVLTGLYAGTNLLNMFVSDPFSRFFRALCFTAMALFALLGIKLVNYNYPDIMIEGGQKKYFNILYLINFLLIAFLLGMIILDLKVVGPYFGFSFSLTSRIMIYGGLIMRATIFVLQFVLLIGMFRLRRIIYQNYMRSVQDIMGGPGSK